MKRMLSSLFVACLCLAMSSTVWALPFTETFLGSKTDNNFFAMAEKGLLTPGADMGYRATFDFFLDANNDQTEPPDGRARLFNWNATTEADVRVRNDLPTADFVLPDILSMSISSAFMYFNFTSQDTDLESIRISIQIPDPLLPNVIVFNDVFDVGRIADGGFNFELNLASAGLLDELNDGRIRSIVLAPAAGAINNSFLLHQVSLTGVADSVPVPEPATMVVLGIGLAGIAGFRRKFHS
ncbi:PEP-CTERM sorting domain-containing protein [Desulfococcus sp.]|uniref:PEP-CTERM sorting domain-containing protein n=1 Tax=Desulfococcus sp. TaxID=2025834 RepID=UPI0035949013